MPRKAIENELGKVANHSHCTLFDNKTIDMKNVRLFICSPANGGLGKKRWFCLCIGRNRVLVVFYLCRGCVEVVLRLC